jgi:hypothetical protein
MRLHEVERGETLSTRLLFNFISFVSGMRLPDAARIVMYDKDFYGDPMTARTHPTMRGISKWSVGERESAGYVQDGEVGVAVVEQAVNKLAVSASNVDNMGCVGQVERLDKLQGGGRQGSS